MHSLDTLNHLVADAISNFRLPNEPRNLYEPISYILGMGGKRIRPVLVLAACNVYSEDVTPAIPSALAVEIFHNFTLVHDDIMDNADKRRGFETIHKKWDSNIAILSGDAMTVLSYRLLAQADQTHLKNIIEIFNDFALGICEGQQMDMDFETTEMVDRQSYLRMIELKTSILLKGALQIGAIIGGATKSDIEAIGEFGRSMGIAFQLQDDLLDCFGDESTFGKRIGGDIVASKKTIITILAAEKLTGEQRKGFIDLYNQKSTNEQQKIEKVMDYYHKLAIKADVERLIDDYLEKAKESLDALDVDDKRKEVLRQILHKLGSRNS